MSFGEGDDFPDPLGPGHDHDDAIQAKGDAAMRGATIGQGIDEKAEFLPGLFRADADQFQGLQLQFRVVDADGAAAEFHAVQNQVVGARQTLFQRFPVSRRQVRP